MELKLGDRVRVRRFDSHDAWCFCSVELLSPNGLSCGLKVDLGVVRTEEGGIVTGFLPVYLMRDEAREIATNTKLEIEVRTPH